IATSCGTGESLVNVISTLPAFAVSVLLSYLNAPLGSDARASFVSPSAAAPPPVLVFWPVVGVVLAAPVVFVEAAGVVDAVDDEELEPHAVRTTPAATSRATPIRGRGRRRICRAPLSAAVTGRPGNRRGWCHRSSRAANPFQEAQALAGGVPSASSARIR